MSSIEYEIIKPIGVLSEKDSGWTKELNLVSWNHGPAQYDIRNWGPDHQKVGKGVTVDAAEAEILCTLLKAEL